MFRKKKLEGEREKAAALALDSQRPKRAGEGTKCTREGGSCWTLSWDTTGPSSPIPFGPGLTDKG